jgi:hypothetical protein
MSENEDAAVARGSISLILTKVNFKDSNDPDGNVVKKATFSHVACLRIKDNVETAGTINYPFVEITSISNQPALILTIDDSISCHPLHDIRSKIFHIGISYGSVPDVIRSVSDNEDDIKLKNNTSRYATTLVCMGKIIISTVLCSHPEEAPSSSSSSSSSSQSYYDSQIHSTPLIEVLNNATLCQAENLLLDYSQGCVHVHSSSSNPFRNFSTRAGT